MATAVEEAARIIEQLTGVPPLLPEKKLNREEKRRQRERIQEFLSLPVPLQEGCLKYAKNIMQTYRKTPS